ncbi:FCD domain-containing protein [Arthrobacter sp.]|uniref:FCD domain-containing protein n=1 Tax=Arthrobacter sp. TaxID=1667 RepID=UPI002810A21C|nr:FCD domain-containing protein [Arthrobacter sp.]
MLHAEVARIAANSWAARLNEQVTSQMEGYHVFPNNSEHRRLTTLAEHEVLVELIAGSDSEAAGNHAFCHVTGAGDEALRAIGSVTLTIAPQTGPK